MDSAPDNLEETIARRLRQRRRELGLKLAEVGRAAGMTDKRVSKYESGENGVSAAVLYRLAGALRAPLTYFFPEPDRTLAGMSEGREVGGEAKSFRPQSLAPGLTESTDV